jgi:hypothetical protein
MSFVNYQIERKVIFSSILDVAIDILEKVVSGLCVSFISKSIKLLFGKNKNEESFDLEKYYMLCNIGRLYEIPDFEIDNPTMNEELINVFYDLSIELLLRYNTLSEDRMRYLARNYSVDTSDRITLIEELEKERRSPSRHDSRYLLGFRSIYVILSDNIDGIDKQELIQILAKLKPFFNNFSHKEYLNHYVY